jgi:hypothetical protein
MVAAAEPTNDFVDTHEDTPTKDGSSSALETTEETETTPVEMDPIMVRVYIQFYVCVIASAPIYRRSNPF